MALGQFDDARAVKALRDAKFKLKQDSKDKPKQVQGVLVMSRLRLGNPEALLQQILDEQRLAGHSFAPNSVATASVGDFDDFQYVYASLREVFSAFGGHDLMERTTVKSFQGSDGNGGKYFVVFDRP